MLDLDTSLSLLLTSATHLPEQDTLTLCTYVRSLLLEESTVQPVQTPVTICGDVHGQFWDVLHLLRLCDGGGGDGGGGGGEEKMGRGRYIFMGDFVDRGYYSLETVTLLFLLKARYPQNITLLRGNHESRQITQVYGFYDECQTKFGSAAVWKAFCGCFDYLNLAAIIDDQILCVHGGLSPDIKTIDQIRVLARVQEIPHEGAFCDLMWSDPEEIDGWAVSPRGAGWLFGGKVTREFLYLNDLSLLARAHQLVQEGYKHMFSSPSPSYTSSLSSVGGSYSPGTSGGGGGEDGLVTVWSAPNYCYRCGNLGSVMRLGYTNPEPPSLSSSGIDDSAASYMTASSTSSASASSSGPGAEFLTSIDMDEDPGEHAYAYGNNYGHDRDRERGRNINRSRSRSQSRSPQYSASGSKVQGEGQGQTHCLVRAGTVGPTGIRKDFIVFDAAPENALDKVQKVGRAGVVQYHGSEVTANLHAWVRGYEVQDAITPPEDSGSLTMRSTDGSGQTWSPRVDWMHGR